MPEQTPLHEFRREQVRRDQQIPFARFAFADVTFTAGATDTDIAHPFTKVDPETIRWMPLAVEGAAYIYRDAPSSTRKAFQSTHLWLRASAACKARLLLVVEQPL